MKREKMCIDTQFDRLERMLKWLIIDSMTVDEKRSYLIERGQGLKDQLPDIGDALEIEQAKTNTLVTQSNAVSVCCKAKIKVNPIEWESPHYVKSWDFWCLKCEKKCEAEA